MNQDEQNLNLLSTFHYVLAAILAFFSCIPFIHVALGIAWVCGAFEGKDAPPRVLGWLFIIMGSLFILCGWTIALLILFAARKLQQRASYKFCFAVAAIECLFMPFGTVLGVFTIILLTKDSVKSLFGLTQPRPLPPAP